MSVLNVSNKSSRRNFPTLLTINVAGPITIKLTRDLNRQIITT